MILALELCEEIVVYGMVSDSYCRSAGRVLGGREGRGREDRGPPVLTQPGGPQSCGAQGVWAPQWAAGAQTPVGPSAWWEGAQPHDQSHPTVVTLGQSCHLPGPPFSRA